MPRALPVLCSLAVLAAASVPASAQWTNRYPAVPGYSHHVYLEGYELPTLAAGITDPAPSPDGRSVAFASRGWLWLLDLDTRQARRITSGGAVDARPAWSPDGKTLAFVRDDSRETSIVVLDLASGTERVVAAEAGIELDPAFTPDGRHLVYAAAGARGIGLRRLDVEASTVETLTDERGVVGAPRPHPDGEHLVYLAKRGGDEVRLRHLGDGSERVVYRGDILSQTRPALSPDGRTLALGLPRDDGWELVLAGVEADSPTLRLGAGAAPPLAPAWSADGAHVYYAQADADERFRLLRILSEGGDPEEVEVAAWDWGTALGTVTIRTTLDGAPAPARLAVTDASGHPLLPEAGQAWFDGQNGTVYVYSPGEIRMRVPAGPVHVEAVQGPATPLVQTDVEVPAGGSASAALAMVRVWGAEAAGWLSGDQHFHLNYGGPYALDPTDLAPVLAGEALDVATPLAANLHTRYEDDQMWGVADTTALPYLVFGQEVRSHFFGHVGLVGTETLFDPWIWGPGYEIFGQADRENATVTAHARREGGIATYVHPVGVRDPFAAGAEGSVPVSLVADGALGDLDGLEVVCLWTDDLGTSEVWYRLLNLGRLVVPMAGSDVMSNFYRTMAPGSVRAYVRTDGDPSYEGFLDGLKAGRSFVTTGPFLDARIGGARPGGVVEAGRAEWSVDLASAGPVERVEIVVNGRVVHTEAGLDEAGSLSARGTVTLPEAGWVAVRAVGDAPTGWPSMAAYPFAHSAPVWIGEVGSVDAGARRAAAADLLRVLDTSQVRFEAAYEGVEAPALRDRFARARAKLVQLAE